jgi:hypothetical protein
MAREVAAAAMAGDPPPPGKWRRSAERRAARRRAAASEGAIARLSRLLAAERAAAAAWEVPGVGERLLAAAPALADLCCGLPVAPARRLQRNVALHAATLPGRGAPLAAWRQAQRGPRLGGVQLVGRDSLPEDQKRTVEVPKIIPADFLQQSDFADHDFRRPLAETIGMVKLSVSDNLCDQVSGAMLGAGAAVVAACGELHGGRCVKDLHDEYVGEVAVEVKDGKLVDGMQKLSIPDCPVICTTKEYPEDVIDACGELHVGGFVTCLMSMSGRSRSRSRTAKACRHWSMA